MSGESPQSRRTLNPSSVTSYGDTTADYIGGVVSRGNYRG